MYCGRSDRRGIVEQRNSRIDVGGANWKESADKRALLDSVLRVEESRGIICSEAGKHKDKKGGLCIEMAG